jgi:NitT/TauT family transport system permease protein
MTRREATASPQARFGFPAAFFALILALWIVGARLHLVPSYDFPTPGEVAVTFRAEAVSGRLLTDIIASLYRVVVGFLLSVAVGLPLGVWLGLRLQPRLTLLPTLNFLRNLSPLAWIPFAITWFGVNDNAAIFLIFLAAVFPISLGAMAAVAEIPSVYFRVGREYGLSGFAMLRQVTLPAILPQLITTLRLTAGLSWLVDVAAEMIAGRDGLGFLILDARNGLRMDLQVVGMIVIGIIGVILDAAIARMAKIPSVRWGYER